MKLRSNESLARYTSLELGGRARHFATASNESEIKDLILWARENASEVAILAGGSNVVVADEGFEGLVVQIATRGITFEESDGVVRLTASAGEPWDALVDGAVERHWSGIECLSGIPGSVGATPIQNVGAYGQEVSDCLESVRVLDRSTLETMNLEAVDCEFAYRSSLFRRQPERFVVLAVTLTLHARARSTLRYPELIEKLDVRKGGPTPREVRRAVLELRKKKSMVLDPADPNHRSAGSFFLNPVVPPEMAEQVARRAEELGSVHGSDRMPSFVVSDGVKIPAAWLIQRAGFEPGLRRGPVGISSRHSLALVHHGGGRTADLLALAREIRSGVRRAFGVTLRPEPVFLGFSEDPLR